MCQRQKRPISDLGFLSYLARNLQLAHGFSLFDAILLLFGFSFFSPPVLNAFHPFHAYNREAAVLECLGQSEEDHPEHSLGLCTDRQGHLCKRDDVARYAHQQHDDTGTKRKAVKKGLYLFLHLKREVVYFNAVQGYLVGSIHLNLLETWKGGVVLGCAERLNLLVITLGLFHELVAGEVEYANIGILHDSSKVYGQ